MNYYELLGVEVNATSNEIKKAFLHKAQLFHPDKNQDKQTATVQFQMLNEAYSILIDQKKRALYDSQHPELFKKQLQITKPMIQHVSTVHDAKLDCHVNLTINIVQFVYQRCLLHINYIRNKMLTQQLYFVPQAQHICNVTQVATIHKAGNTRQENNKLFYGDLVIYFTITDFLTITFDKNNLTFKINVQRPKELMSLPSFEHYLSFFTPTTNTTLIFANEGCYLGTDPLTNNAVFGTLQVKCMFSAQDNSEFYRNLTQNCKQLC